MEQHSEMGPPPTPTTVDPPSYAESVAETLTYFSFQTGITEADATTPCSKH